MKKTFNYLAISSCLLLTATFAHADSSSYQRYSEGMSKSMDANSDGKITREEFDALRAKKFQELDSNNDGRITVEEMKGGHEKMFGSGRNKMSDEERNSRGSPRSQGDNMNTRNQSSRGGWSDNSQELPDNMRRSPSGSQDRSGGSDGSGMSSQSSGSRSNNSGRSGSGSSSSSSSEGSGNSSSGSSGGSSGAGQ